MLPANRLTRPIRVLTRCRLCWRITLAVFAAIFAVEAAILVPSYRNYERDLLARIDEVGRTAATSGFLLLARDGHRALADVGTALTRTSNIRGGAIYLSSAAPPIIFGETPSLSPRTDGRPAYAAERDRYEAVWPPAATGLPFTIVGRMDSSKVRGELVAFLWRIGGLVLLISSFVCVVTMIILGRTVLGPLLAVRDNLVAALDDPASADRFILAGARHDELGDVVARLNDMLQRVAKTYREELATMLSMVDRSADGMLVYDADGQMVYANQACLALCGYDTLAEMEASSAPRFCIAAQDHPLHLVDLLTAGPYSGEATLTGRASSPIHCMISGARLEDAGGKAFRYFATFTDISKLRQMYDSLARQHDELESSSRAKSQFLANMSHELRTPLNAIIGFSEIMRTELAGPMSNPRYKEFSEHIHESGGHLLNLINDVLDLSKVESGKLELEEDIVQPEVAIESSLRQIQGRADAHRIRLDTRIAPALPGLRADERKLKQVLINLLSNAVKFTPDGGCISVSAETVACGDLAIRIVDTGVGISEQDLHKVFSPFMQVDGSLNRRYEGTGLGLPLTKAIVELHDGSIELASRIGEGTTVTVQLPRTRLVA